VRHTDYIATANRVRHGQVRLLYIAPETLLRPETLLLLDQSRVRRLAVDEAHCISEWGHDFRPEYRHLQEVRQRFPQAACLALTATATGRVREDIRRLLAIPAVGEFVASFNRPNLFLAAELRQDDGLAQTLAFLEQRRGQGGIIYCGTRRQVEALSAALNANGWPALPYHAGLEDTVRCRNQERFMRDELPIMVATIAFGLGINKANVRFVLHFNLPKDLESYYQEIGRAGRDGLPADCLLLHSRRDAIVHSRFIERGAESERAGRKARLNALVRFAEAPGCRRVPLLGYFGERLAPPCGRCENCVPAPKGGKLANVIDAAPKLFSRLSRPVARKRCDEIGERFRAGHTLEQIARSYAIQPETVIAHLYRFHQGGGQLDARRLLAWSRLPEPDQRRVFETFDRLGMERLAPIREALSATVDYGELHLLRLYALCRDSGSAQPMHSAAGAGNSRPISPQR
jgi:ATP-dependent DNA helicase RecQ